MYGKRVAPILDDILKLKPKERKLPRFKRNADEEADFSIWSLILAFFRRRRRARRARRDVVTFYAFLFILVIVGGSIATWLRTQRVARNELNRLDKIQNLTEFVPRLSWFQSEIYDAVKTHEAYYQDLLNRYERLELATHAIAKLIENATSVKPQGMPLDWEQIAPEDTFLKSVQATGPNTTTYEAIIYLSPNTTRVLRAVGIEHLDFTQTPLFRK